MARPKGSQNKLSGLAKENISAVFIRLGGTAAMAKWAKENLTEFYRIYARLLPVETHLSDSDGKPLNFTLSVPPKNATLGPDAKAG